MFLHRAARPQANNMTMPHPPNIKISVVLCCFNQASVIRQAVESLLMQRFHGLVEVVVADDASTDGTLEIIQSYEKESPFAFKYCDKKPNMGHAKNYQRAFAACDGDYIAILEGDDYWVSPYHLQKHVDFLDAHRECVLAMNRYYLYDSTRCQFRTQPWRWDGEYRLVTTQEMALGNKLGNLSACVFRKAEIDKLLPDFFDLGFADWMLGMVLGQGGFLALLKESTSVYRISSAGQWSKLSAEESRQEILSCLDVYNRYLGFRYDEQFVQHKRKMLGNLPKPIVFHDYFPPILFHLAHALLPPFFYREIRALLERLLTRRASNPN